MGDTPPNIVVGVAGGIAAYKAVSLVRELVLRGATVTVIPTASALKFVGVPTWEAISRNAVPTSLFDAVAEVRHVALGQNADLVIVAPATAHTLASMAAGLARTYWGPRYWPPGPLCWWLLPCTPKCGNTPAWWQIWPR